MLVVELVQHRLDRGQGRELPEDDGGRSSVAPAAARHRDGQRQSDPERYDRMASRTHPWASLSLRTASARVTPARRITIATLREPPARFSQGPVSS